MNRTSGIVVTVLISLILLLSLGVACAATDSIPPSIEGVADSQITTASATITWITDEPASSQVEYGVTESYGTMSTLNSALDTSHTVTISGLAPSTDYHYRVISVDKEGNEAKSFGWFFATRTQFTLTGSQVTKDLGCAMLRVQFTASDYVSFALTNPDGIQTGFGFADKGVTAVNLDLAGYGETPRGGRYTIIVSDLPGEATTTFDFQGASASISDLALAWTFETWSLDYTLENVSFKVSNTGDLPVSIYDGEFSINGSQGTFYFLGEMVLPGEAITISSSTYVYGISEGQKAFSLTLKDSEDSVMATYTTDVTPS